MDKENQLAYDSSDKISVSSSDEDSGASQPESVLDSDLDEDGVANAQEELLALAGPINDSRTIPSCSTTNDLQSPRLLEGSMFHDKKTIREAVFRAESNIGWSVYVKKQQRKIVLYFCKHDGCLFRACFSLLQRLE
jgi:hypothetical protein